MTRAAPAAVGLSPERENAEPRVARLPLDTAVESGSPASGVAAANRAAVINHAVNAFAALLGEPNDCDREHAHRAAILHRSDSHGLCTRCGREHPCAPSQIAAAVLNASPRPPTTTPALRMPSRRARVLEHGDRHAEVIAS